MHLLGQHYKTVACVFTISSMIMAVYLLEKKSYCKDFSYCNKKILLICKMDTHNLKLSKKIVPIKIIRNKKELPKKAIQLLCTIFE